MTVFTYSEARQNFSSLLELAKVEGEVQVIRRDGTTFTITPINNKKRSPLDVKGVRTKATTKDIVSAIRESRRR